MNPYINIALSAILAGLAAGCAAFSVTPFDPGHPIAWPPIIVAGVSAATVAAISQLRQSPLPRQEWSDDKRAAKTEEKSDDAKS